jgi:hypothetical protein
VQNIKFFVRFYFASGTVQCLKDFPYFLFGGALSLGGDFRRTNGQLGEKKQIACNEDLLLIYGLPYCIAPWKSMFETTSEAKNSQTLQLCLNL